MHQRLINKALIIHIFAPTCTSAEVLYRSLSDEEDCGSDSRGTTLLAYAYCTLGGKSAEVWVSPLVFLS